MSWTKQSLTPPFIGREALLNFALDNRFGQAIQITFDRPQYCPVHRTYYRYDPPPELLEGC